MSEPLGDAAPLTIAQALGLAAGCGVDRLDAQLLLGHLLQRPRAWLIAHDDARLPAEQLAAYRQLLAQRADQVPLAYLLGEHEFHGLPLKVARGVLDPRPDTETLVDWALALLDDNALPGRRVLDLGTGSGAIVLAVAHACAQAGRPVQAHASDLSVDALGIAQANAARHAPTVVLRHGAWWACWAGACFDLVLSNPPYIAADDPHLPALRHEPRQALVAGPDGLDDLRAIIAGAPAHLAPGAWLLLEHGWDQADAVQALLAQAGFVDLQGRRDLGGHVRCSGGRWRGAPSAGRAPIAAPGQ